MYLFEDTLCYDCYDLETHADPPNFVAANYWLFRAYEAARASTGEDDERVQHIRRRMGSQTTSQLAPIYDIQNISLS